MITLRDIQNASFWNIGFCEQSPENLLKEEKLSSIIWMKHPYKDRFFADPFIYSVSETEIVIFVEEYIFNSPPGLLVELRIDRKSMKLLQRYELLTLSTHLSYPIHIREGNEVLVYPENGMSGKLNMYHYDPICHKLVNPETILSDSVFDSTMMKRGDNSWLLVATKYPDNLKCAYAYESESPHGPFRLIQDSPFQTDCSHARMAGNFFEVNGEWYRPAQNCSERYGGAIVILHFNPQTLEEHKVFEIKPESFEYNLGIHTINFHNSGFCVVDGYGYLHPYLGRLYTSQMVTSIKSILKKILKH